jgi:mannose-1-phosphate guanylyltransferase
LPHVVEVVIVTNRDTYFLVNDNCREVATERTLGFVLEPMARNTCPAICAATEAIRERHGDDVIILVMPADQLINDIDALIEATTQAALTATQGRIVTFGVVATRPETGYGYIQFAPEPDSSNPCIHPVTRFVEKPPAEIAQQMVADGRHLWNAGMFCFQPQVLLEQARTFAPDIVEAVEDAVRKARRSQGTDGYVIELDATAFKRAEDISIDYAVIERSKVISVVPCDMGWSDIGSWQAISELMAPDERGNRIEGEARLHDTDGCYIRTDGRLVTAIGVKDLIIVDTPDALLVAAKDRVQDVKKIVADLKRDQHDSHRIHRTVQRPWGTYTVLEEGDRFKMKRIVVKPGAALSLQMHHHRSEHWVVVSGCADVVNGERTISLQPNESTYIPAGEKHRLVNPGTIDLVLIEVQCGEYLGEDDIVRFDDKYGRTVV